MKVGIIGCGAAGMMAAITAERCGHDVTVIEHGVRPGKKLLATGNGRCNFTNADISEQYYNKSGRKLFSDVYKRFDNQDTISFFESVGIVGINKNGYYYPRSEQAASVADSLLYEISRLGVNVITECNVKSVRKALLFTVNTDKGTFSFDRLIIACGSKAYPKTGSDGSGYELAESLGHTVIKPLPALCALYCKGFDFKAVAGVRAAAKVSLFINDKFIACDTGELQLTDYGISGIPVFQISAEAVRAFDEGNVRISIDFMPEWDEDTLRTEIVNRMQSCRYVNEADMLKGMLNDKLARALVSKLDEGNRHCNKPAANKNTNQNTNKNSNDIRLCELAALIKNVNVVMTGHKDFDNCQVCSGGVKCDELNENLMSKKCEGLYFAGEIIDVNGLCGGYNLQWAWSSGYVAGLLL